MMCLGSVCHVFTTSHRHNVLTKASQNFALSWMETTTNFVCHSFVQVVLGFIVFAQHLAGVRLNFSMKTFCCPFVVLLRARKRVSSAHENAVSMIVLSGIVIKFFKAFAYRIFMQNNSRRRASGAYRFLSQNSLQIVQGTRNSFHS